MGYIFYYNAKIEMKGLESLKHWGVILPHCIGDILEQFWLQILNDRRGHNSLGTRVALWAPFLGPMLEQRRVGSYSFFCGAIFMAI